MRVNDSHKLRIIFLIDILLSVFNNTAWTPELKMLRKKYIYKDISYDELKKDYKFIKDIAEIAATIKQNNNYDKKTNISKA
jgi:hypothetical protein